MKQIVGLLTIHHYAGIALLRLVTLTKDDIITLCLSLINQDLFIKTPR